MTSPIALPLDLPEIDAEVAGGSRFRRSVLPSGIRLLTEEVPGAASSAIGMYVPLGSRDEPEAQRGSSHFLEHLLFKGTATRTARELALAFERVGGDVNAATSHEQTVYHARVRGDDLPMAIDVLSDMITASTLDPGDFELERGVILEEIAMADDDPVDVLWERAYAAYFNKHPLARPIAGTPESIRAAQRDATWDFYREFYQPRQLVVTIAGKVNHEAARAQLEEALARGGWNLDVPGTPTPRRATTPEPFSRERGMVTIDRDLEQTHLVLLGAGRHAASPDRTALGVLHHVLGGGMSSRLFQQVREQRGLVYSVYSFSLGHADAGLQGVTLSCLPEKTAEAVRVVRGELERIAADGIDEVELADARTSGAGSGALELESMPARMRRLGRAELTLGEFTDLDGAVAKLDAVSAPDVQALAQEFASKPLTATTIGPLTEAARTQLEETAR